MKHLTEPLYLFVRQLLLIIIQGIRQPTGRDVTLPKCYRILHSVSLFLGFPCYAFLADVAVHFASILEFVYLFINIY